MKSNKNLSESNLQVESAVNSRLIVESLPVMIVDFGNFLEEKIQETWSNKEELGHLEAMTANINEIAESVIRIGDLGLDYLNNIPKKNDFPLEVFPVLQVHFLWMDQAKSYLLLWRNVLFQTQKATILFLENKVSKSDLEKLKADSRITISAAKEDLLSFFTKNEESFASKESVKKRQLAKWLLQQNPYPIYKKQLEDLSSQSNRLLEQFKELNTVLEQTLQIKSLINGCLNSCTEDIKSIQVLAEKSAEVILQNADQKIGKVSGILEDLESDLQPSYQLEQVLSQLEYVLDAVAKKMQVPVDINEGFIQLKEVSFQKNISQWLEAEIFQDLHKIWEKRDVLELSLRSTLLNIRNRLVLLQDNKDGFDSVTISMPLKQYLKKFEDTANKQLALRETIEKKLERAFGIFLVYNIHQNFLYIQLQSTLNKFRDQQNRWLGRAFKWIKGKLEIIRKLRTSVEAEETLSTAEKIVRFIHSKTASAGNDQYSNIFLSKGYIGSSFCVGRKTELEHVENLIQQWQDGFRGAIILSGQRFSGKTLFGEMVVNQFFPKNTVRLIPNSKINVQSRNFTSTYDLEESLKFIRKHTLNEKVLIWIDDLELWNDFDHPLSHNVRKLFQYMDNFSGQMFFMVSMNNWTKNYLEKVVQLTDKFQSEINLDRVKNDDIKYAILVRHGATHKELIDSEENVVSPRAFQKVTSKIYKTTEGNIGEALRNWTFSVRPFDEEKVMLQDYQNYQMPDFLNPDTAILLRTILIEKRSNEYRLSKLFGEPFQDRYKAILQRLINTGLLTRHEDGWLEINEVLVNELARLLDRKEYIKFYYSK
jgi:hypothetical protein